jgi:arylsulfatase A-like enzyme
MIIQAREECSVFSPVRHDSLAAHLLLLPCLLIAISAGADGGVGSLPGPAKNLILISLDTVRPDHLGAYGYEKPTSPGFDTLAESGTLFRDAVAVSPWTLPSNATLLTGVYPLHHRARGFRTRISGLLPTLPEVFGRAGFRTAAIVSSALIDRSSGLDRGFDQFGYVSEWGRGSGGGKTPRDPGALVTEEAIRWLSRNGGAHSFLFLHYYDAHTDYSPGPVHTAAFTTPYVGDIDGSTEQLTAVLRGERRLTRADLTRLVELYDGSIRRLDDEIRKLLDFLEAEGLLETTAILVTSDHGEEFMEHGGVLHARTYFREVIGIPFVLTGPGVPRGLRLDEPVSQIDIAPTLLALAGIPIPGSMQGIDLRRYWGANPSKAVNRSLFAEADHSNRFPDQFRMLRKDRYKLIWDRASGATQLYDRTADPRERHDVSRDHPALLEELLSEIRAFDAPMASDVSLPPPSLSPDERKSLRRLGYIE